MADIRIEYIPLTKLQRWPRNPKGHDLGALTESVTRFGYTEPLVIDETSGRIVAGHGRLDLLQHLKASGAQAPERIRTEDGDWLIPVIRGIAFENEREAEAYLVAANRVQERGGWDYPDLADVLADLAATQGLQGTGFDGDDLDAMLKDLNPPETRGERHIERWEVPDALWPSDNEWGVPLLDIKLQAQAANMPIVTWGSRSRKQKMIGTYHFYTDDYRFDALWRDPSEIVNSACACVVEPNFSIGSGTPRAVALWAVYRKRWLARFWQSFGLRVFVDMNVPPDAQAMNLLGVPQGWAAYATRWLDAGFPEIGSPEDSTLYDYERAKERAGDVTPLFMVVGGMERAEAFCQEHGFVWVKEFSGRIKNGERKSE